MFGNKVKRYYPDFYIHIKTPMVDQKCIIEIKHSKEASMPSKGTRKSRKTILNEKFTWEKNQSK